MQDPFDDDAGDDAPAGGVLTVTLPMTPPRALIRRLPRAVPEEAALSRSRLMRMIAEGAVSRDGVAVTDPKAKVAPGEVCASCCWTPPEALEAAGRGHSADGGL